MNYPVFIIFNEAIKNKDNKHSDAKKFILTSKVQVADGTHQTPK